MSIVSTVYGRVKFHISLNSCRKFRTVMRMSTGDESTSSSDDVFPVYIFWKDSKSLDLEYKAAGGENRLIPTFLFTTTYLNQHPGYLYPDLAWPLSQLTTSDQSPRMVNI
ncbi:hypothetical protein RRG08_052624 [Elysia crispata]|uniref:Uncharacterized protein n=1 Tax=Elysia crispata TaxID=231223 RepID=A0AAE1DXS7_9GAST|nr:hypothetical protein RRG08_052624 [Elysia crispata]